MPRREKGSSPPCKWVASLIMRAEYMHLYTCFFSLPYETWGCIESPRGGATKCSLAATLSLSSSPPFVWRWPSDRFLRDVLLGVNEWVSKEEQGVCRKLVNEARDMSKNSKTHRYRVVGKPGQMIIKGFQIEPQ